MTYKTIGDQEYILDAINQLYLDGQGIELDPMFGQGGFYKGSLPVPRYIGDINGQTGVHIDARYLPFTGATIRSMILDPPFMHAQGKDSALARYATYKSQRELQRLYAQLIAEASRVLAPGGVLVFKTQDTVESGKQVWSHIYVYMAAVALGFEVLDLFILPAKSRLTGHNHQRQVHARKWHAYFWVFRLKKAKPVLATSIMYDAHGNAYHQLPLENTDEEVQPVQLGGP
jgi:hypothetical protein